MLYSSKAVANYFLNLANSQDQDLDQLKLQKMVYFAHGWCLSVTGEPLIPDRIEAWPYGPVVPLLYYELLDWGNRPIKSALVERKPRYNESTNQIEYSQYVPDLWAYSDAEGDAFQFTTDLLDWIYRSYGHMTGPQLSYLTHEKDGPWESARKNRAGSAKPTIPNSVIESHFIQKLAEFSHSAQVDAT